MEIIMKYYHPFDSAQFSTSMIMNMTYEIEDYTCLIVVYEAAAKQ